MRTDDLMAYLMDPVKGRILIEIQRKGKATVGMICECCNDIPRSSMYRHISKMEKDGIIQIAGTVQKRGTLEKTYSVNSKMIEAVMDATEMDRDKLYLLYLRYCYTFMSEFRENLMSCEGDVKGIPLSFTVAPFYATKEELEFTMMKIGGIIQGLVENKPSEDRMLFSMGIMVTPPKKA